MCIVKLVVRDPTPGEPVNPCQPSPCGPNADCRLVGNSPLCSCLATFVGQPPNCRPECISNSECENHLACINQKCKDPCPGLCGANAECRVFSHTAMCTCLPGYLGDPFSQCTIKQSSQPEILSPCSPNPCGSNAICRQQNNVGSCQCIADYTGNPYEGCRPECILNADCPSDRACINSKCQDPCPGVCARNAFCRVVNHSPLCTCNVGFSGDPFQNCYVEEVKRKEL